MLQASYICLGLITPCPETFHPLYLPRRLITPCLTTNVISTKKIPKTSRLINVSLIASTNLPINMEPPWSLLALSLVIRPTVTPPYLNKGNLLLLRSSFLFCLGPNHTLQPPLKKCPRQGHRKISTIQQAFKKPVSSSKFNWHCLKKKHMNRCQHHQMWEKCK